ncbi:MAG: hypothetical protein NTZ09_18200 [Candidatus Hydrogenedentes bacterium]|nr:hypothetical protein [Candidatus Hydrogenedentota bacterium]
MRAILVVCCVLSLAAADTPWQLQKAPPRPRAHVYALEGLGALGGLAGCAVGGGCAGLLAGLVFVGPPFSGTGGYELVPNGGWDTWAYVMLGVGVIGIPASTGYATSRAGENLGESGSQTWAIVGAYAGVPVTAGLVAFGAELSWRTPAAAVPLFVLGGLAIPAGAVVGYNFGIKREVPAHGFEGRLQAPGVALTSVELPDHSVEYGVKLQLAGLRF